MITKIGLSVELSLAQYLAYKVGYFHQQMNQLEILDKSFVNSTTQPHEGEASMPSYFILVFE